MVHMVTTMESNSVDNLEERKLIKVNQHIINFFSQLPANNDHIQQTGAIGILRNLSYRENINVESRNHQYSLKRLIRGLGASQMASKKGFYISFTAYLMLHGDANIDDLLRIVESELKPSSSLSKSENADIYMGRILFCGSLMRSKLLMNSDLETQTKIIENLLNSGTQRSYLSYVSISFLVDFIDNLDEVSMKNSFWPILSKELSKAWTEHSLDTFYALLFIDNKFPTLIDKKFIKLNLGTETILDKETMPFMLKLITDLPRIASYKHPVHKLICEKLVTTDFLVDFWMSIDKKFVKPSKSIEYLGLALLNHIIPNVEDKHLLPPLLSSNFLSYMLKRLNTSKMFYKDDIASMFRNVLIHYSVALKDKEIDTKVQIEVIKKLIYYPGDLIIEKITGVKILQMIVENMTANGVKKVAKIYSAIIENTKLRKIKSDERSWSNAERVYACQMLSKLLDHTAMAAEYEWRLNQLTFLFKLGFCEVDTIDSTLAINFEGCFYHALDHKFMKLNDSQKLLNDLIYRLNDILFINKSQTLRKPFTESSTEAWKKLIKFMSKTDNHSQNKEIVLIFQMTALIMGLLIFSDSEMAISVIDEIHHCFERFTDKKSSSEKKKQKEPNWVDVLVDLFLSLLSKNSHLLRSLVQYVFPRMCSMLTATAIHQILEVLDPSNEQNLLISEDQQNNNWLNSDSDGESEDPTELNKNRKRKKLENDEDDNDDEDDNVTEDDDDDDDENDDSDDMDEDNEDETLNEKLRIAVSQALNHSSGQTEDEDIDIDEIDEEEGKRLDESLAAAFRILRDNRQSNNRKQSKTAEMLMNFRTRVIDLLEIYLDSGPSLILILDILPPLFTLLEFCIKDHHQRPLENRIRSCLKKLSSLKKFKDTDGVDGKLLLQLFKFLVEKGEKSTSVCHEMGDKVAECCTFLIKCAQHINISTETIISFLTKHLNAFFKERDSSISVILFRNILQINWDGNWKFILPLIEYAFDQSIRSFRRGQALDLLITFYRNSTLIKNEEYTDLRNKVEKNLFLKCIQLLKESVRQNNINGGSNENRDDETTKEITGKFLYLLLTLLNTLYPIHLPKVWNWEKMGTAMTEYRKYNTLSKDARKPFNKLANSIGVKIQVQPPMKQNKKEKKQKSLVNGNCENHQDKSSKEPLNSVNDKANDEKTDKKETNGIIKNVNSQHKKNKKKLKTSDPELEKNSMLNTLKTVNADLVARDESTFISVRCNKNKKNKNEKRTLIESQDEPQKSKRKKMLKIQ